MIKLLANLIRLTTEILHWILSFFIDEQVLLEWKFLHICWWFKKHGWKIPKYFIGTNTAATFPGTGTDVAASGLSNSWSTDPGRIVADDNSYTYVGGFGEGTTHYLRGSNFGFAIPSGAIIDGIVVKIGRKAYENTATDFVKDYRLRIVKADGTISTTDRADTSTKWPTTSTRVTTLRGRYEGS